ncbi:hypothetical protein [Fulvivirga ligni]|uniref:hypothetical protein n=1 Tax=Fulvivirga ligni TaxID=2904246 RepID=UPI001F37FD87|nr:hypothetical protein [Fulvivirga ligni]UII23157.1 hypothetical protein LVD16_07950 [Fulvivirga ligni]
MSSKTLSALAVCMCLSLTLSAQSSKQIIDDYLLTIGGRESWEKLKTRVCKEEMLQYSSEGLFATSVTKRNFINYYAAPNNYLKYWVEDLYTKVYCETNNSVWTYSADTKRLTVLSDEFIEKAKDFPRINALSIINMPVESEAESQDSLYRIGFKDARWQRTIYLFFDKETKLVVKQEYHNTGGDHHEYYYKDYRVKDGFKEPYVIEKFQYDQLFYVIHVEDISYNVAIDSKIFETPDKHKSERGTQTYTLKKSPNFRFTND